MKKAFATIFLFAFILTMPNPCYAADRVYDKIWNITQSAYTKNWGLKGFPYQLTVHDEGNYYSNYLLMFNHQVTAYYKPQYYASPDLWFSVAVNATYKQNGVEYASVGYNGWTAMTWILPPGYTITGGQNNDYMYLTNTPRTGDYTSVVSAPDLYWPLVDIKTITFN